MEYSLINLNKNSKLNQLTLNYLINTLNLIGIEVDAISKERLKNTFLLENIKIILKIPSNREDLLIEHFFQKEMSLIFNFQQEETWKNLKNNYKFLLKQKYLNYQNYLLIPISSPYSNIVFYAIEIKNFKNIISPLWIQEKLNQFGIESINTIQDLVNLIQLEWGQFINIQNIFEKNNPKDFNNLNFEFLNKKETYRNLYDEESILPIGTIVLKNNENVILSVVGNINFQVSNIKENHVIFESIFIENFDNLIEFSIIQKQMFLKHFRKIFLTNLKYSFQRFLTLLEILNLGDIVPKKFYTKNSSLTFESKKIIKLRKQSLKNFLNLEIIDENILKKAGLKLACKTSTDIFLIIPNYRKDLLREIDIIEEYSRFIGYKNFIEILPTKLIFGKKTKNYKTNKFLKQFFINYGFQEVLTNPIQDLLEKTNSSIEIKNPLNKEFSILRTTPFSRLIEIVNFNLRSSISNTNFFEVGRVFKKNNKKIIEEEKLSAIFTLSKISNSTDQMAEWFSGIGIIENLLSNFGFKILIKKPIKNSLKFFHPSRSILIKFNSKILGIFGQIDSRCLNAISTKTKIYFLELNLKYFQDIYLSAIPNLYLDYSKYPIIKKDLSLLVNKKINFLSLKELIKLNSEYLKKLTFFDFYTNQESKNIVNIGIRLEFQSQNCTLTTEIIEKEINQIKELMMKEFQIEFR